MSNDSAKLFWKCLKAVGDVLVGHTNLCLSNSSVDGTRINKFAGQLFLSFTFLYFRKTIYLNKYRALNQALPAEPQISIHFIVSLTTLSVLSSMILVCGNFRVES